MNAHQLATANGELNGQSPEASLVLASEYGARSDGVANCVTNQAKRALMAVRNLADKYYDWHETPFFVINGEFVGQLLYYWQYQEALKNLGLEETGG
ncbi:MAG: hypothetical protein NPIRA03_37060 [Nitrospirales bacterium]|nr:MAG: hypothetical protein NPIRA03_37060 [Nitrospirales bacterium]